MPRSAPATIALAGGLGGELRGGVETAKSERCSRPVPPGPPAGCRAVEAAVRALHQRRLQDSAPSSKPFKSLQSVVNAPPGVTRKTVPLGLL